MPRASVEDRACAGNWTDVKRSFN